MNNNERVLWADIARGIGIILVVLAHTIVPSLRGENAAGFLWIFIYNFHMPLFFFVSGWLFEKNITRYTDRKKFMLSKARLLMLPYLVYSVIAYALVFTAMHLPPLAKILSSAGYGSATLKDAALGILFYFNHIDQHLWFVYSLFIVFILNISLPCAMRTWAAIIITLALYVSKAFVHYPAILNYTAGDLFFFSLARCMLSRGKDAIISSKVKFAAAVVVFICTNVVYSYFYITEMPREAVKAALYIVRAVCSVSGILTVCTLSDMICKTRVSRLFTKLGGYSYDIYLIHAPFLVSGLMGILLAYSPISAAICCAAVCVTGIWLPYSVSRFIIRRFNFLSVPLLGRNFSNTIHK